jgi:formamidopyrimidine-DNA glycosylase
MLELPEVETIRRDLEREAAGKRVKAVEVTATKPLRGITKKAFVERLEGAKIEAIARRGLLVTARLDTGELLVADLGSSGQLRRATPKEPVDKATAVVITFTQGGQLRFRDAKGTAGIWLATPDDLLSQRPELASPGLDPVDEPLSWTTFGHLLIRRKSKLKTVLTDQSAIVGLGDLYADEILWAAGLRHDRPSEGLSTQEIRRLYRALVETLHDAVKYGGTSVGDEGFVSVHGKRGDYNEHLQVFEREKQPCRRCRGTVTKVRFQNHTTYLCPSCQV